MRRRRKRRAAKTVLYLVLAVLLAAAGVYAYLHIRYPLEYVPLIKENAQKYGLEPAFVAAVIWAESSFRPESTSAVGACGLMQIMPETGAWIAPKIGIDNFKQEMLYDPQVNMAMGCWYLSYLQQRFAGDTVKVLAGYNAGPKNVEKWQAQWPQGHRPAAEDIPFPETQQYVRRVSRAQKVYERLYDFS